MTSQQPTYTFTSGLDADEMPLVEVHKSWPGGHQIQPISVHQSLTDAMTAEAALVDLRQEHGLETAMRQAERQAVAHDFLDPARADGRLFSDGPSDPFTTHREAELAGLDYTYDVVAQPQGTYELHSIKTWQVDGQYGAQSIALGTYDRSGDANAEQEMLRGVRDFQGLEAEMRTVERIAVDNGTLAADRLDPRLFTSGPPDPFTTTRQQELDASLGYTFRAGPTIDEQANGSTHSLNLINVERDGADYRFAYVEYLRVSAEDAAYVDDAASKFNRMVDERGVGPAVAAAGTWSRQHGTETPLQWRELDADRLDPPSRVGAEPEMDTQPLPRVPDMDR